ncbi:MAG TPA: alpha/beta hydrolase [Candidatus Limnocylindrales bacterium]|nr:alpha/beta hydrolase [Candidatus Limnocylindrales bacterium]
MTFVLIPGAGGLAWEWHRLEPELRALGHDVVPIELPAGDDSAGLAEYADAVVEAIGERTGIVLVAQSFGGFTAPLVCERVKVALLVLLNAMVPLPGETFGAWWSNTGQGSAMREYAATLGLTPTDLQDDRIVYYHDLPDDLVQEALRLDAEQSSTPLDQPWPLRGWPDVPTRVLSGRDDRMFPATFQRRVAQERLGITADEIAGGHMVALANPKGLAERLHRYAAEVSRG